MENHPIPQQISSYQFRLVGDMTLKQFFQIAGGALVAIIIYSLPILGIIKWPLVVASALLGIALAFLPLEERPLEHWLIAFFKTIYSPTLFFWKKSEPTNFFQEEAVAPVEKIVYPGGEEKLKEYLTAPVSDKLSDKLEKIEGTFLSGISSMFGTSKPAEELAFQPQVAEEEPAKKEKKPLTVPSLEFIRVPAAPKPQKLVVEETSPQGKTEQIIPITPTPASEPSFNAQQAQFSIDAAPPNPPTTPNTLTGQVVDTERKIIQGAILEIRDSTGRAVRALKSNMLGHFLVVTPLQNGKYEIITEKDGFIFEPLSFMAEGKIIPPIAIMGKKVSS